MIMAVQIAQVVVCSGSVALIPRHGGRLSSSSIPSRPLDLFPSFVIFSF